MFEKGLKLKLIKIDSACRKQSRSEHKIGVVIVKLKLLEDKKSGFIS